MEQVCTHADQIQDVSPLSEGCADCVAQGDKWVHLRMCSTCGYVGCCDDSKNRHAGQHFHTTKHAIVASMVSGEVWRYCYIDEMFLNGGDEVAGAEDIPEKSKLPVPQYELVCAN